MRVVTCRNTGRGREFLRSRRPGSVVVSCGHPRDCPSGAHARSSTGNVGSTAPNVTGSTLQPRCLLRHLRLGVAKRFRCTHRRQDRSRLPNGSFPSHERWTERWQWLAGEANGLACGRDVDAERLLLTGAQAGTHARDLIGPSLYTARSGLRPARSLASWQTNPALPHDGSSSQLQEREVSSSGDDVGTRAQI